MMLCFFVLLGYMATVTTSEAVAAGFIVPAIAAIGHIVYLFLNGKKPPKASDNQQPTQVVSRSIEAYPLPEQQINRLPAAFVLII